MPKVYAVPGVVVGVVGVGWGDGVWGWGILDQVSDNRDAPHRPSTRNATSVKKKGDRNYTFFPILMKNRGRYTTFSPFMLKYREMEEQEHI